MIKEIRPDWQMENGKPKPEWTLKLSRKLSDGTDVLNLKRTNIKGYAKSI